MNGTRRYWDEATETVSRDELAARQLAGLRWQVGRCWERSPFYRERLEAAGVHPEDVRSLEDVRRIPVVTKQQLRDEQRAHPPFGRYAVAERETWRELHPSSGSTGWPVNTIWSAGDVERIADFTARTMWSFGTRPDDVVQNAFSIGLWVAGMAVHYACQRIGCFQVPIGATNTEKQLEYFERPGATVLLATPSYGLYLAERLRERGIAPESLPLRRGCFGGEAGTENDATRAKLEAGLGIDAYDYYGLAEVGPTFASECEAKAGLHWAEDHHLIEVLYPNTREPVRPGELGVLVITHLTREATPMLRYWTNDIARVIADPCACGRTHARSPGGILGRLDDLVIFKGAKFYPAQVEKVVRSFAELSDEFRIELTRDAASGLDECAVVAERATADADPGGLAASLGTALRTELGVTPSIRLEPFGTLERTEFKAKRLLDLRGQT
jgi:phenylacetate-CoA ligase